MRKRHASQYANFGSLQKEVTVTGLGPENDEPGGIVRYIAFLSIERTSPYGIPYLKPMEEPICIESRYVGASARRNNDRTNRLNRTTILKNQWLLYYHSYIV